MKRPKIVMVEWVDSCAHTGWTERESYEPGTSECVTVGWLAHRDREKITVAASCDPYNGHFNNAMSIPMVAVRSVKILQTAGGK